MAHTDELVGLPDGGPTTLPAVKARLRIAADDTRDDAELADVVDAVNARVRRWPVAELAVGHETWPTDVALGAAMLAARLWRRRNSPAGVEAMGPDGATYVMRNDPDVAMLLRLGSWQPPGLG